MAGDLGALLPGASLHQYRTHTRESEWAAGAVPGAPGARGAGGLFSVRDGQRLGGLRELLPGPGAVRAVALLPLDGESAGAPSEAASTASSHANVCCIARKY